MIIFPGHLFIKRPQQEIQAVKYLQLYREYRTTVYYEDATILGDHQDILYGRCEIYKRTSE